MHQSVDAAGQTDEDAEVGDGLDEALRLVHLLVVDCELVPRIGHALLHAQRDTAPLFVDFQNHHLDLIGSCSTWVWMFLLVQSISETPALDALLDLDEAP